MGIDAVEPVGNTMERAGGGVTHGPRNKNSTMMHKGKIRVESSACDATGGQRGQITDVLKLSTKVTWADVVRKGEDTNNERRTRFTKNIDSRDHSLETIPLTK